MSKKLKKGGLDQYGTERFGRLILPQCEKSVELKGLNCQFDRACFKAGEESENFLEKQNMKKMEKERTERPQ